MITFRRSDTLLLVKFSCSKFLDMSFISGGGLLGSDVHFISVLGSF